MPTDNLVPEPWFSFLSELDRAVDVEVRLDCMGGFVVTMVYGFFQANGGSGCPRNRPERSWRADTSARHARRSLALEIQDLSRSGGRGLCARKL